MFLFLFLTSLLWAREETSTLPPLLVVAPGQWSESRGEVSGNRWESLGSKAENALAAVPGLAFSQNGGAGQPRAVFIRGSRAEDTLVLFNGIPLNDPLSPSRSFDFSQLPFGNIEKVDVIKGPQSVLYGSDAQGGVIQFYTKENTEPAKARLEGGSFETYSASGAWQGLGFGYFQSKGFSAADEREGNTEKDGAKLWNINASKTVPIGASSSVKLGGIYHSSKVDTDRNGGRGGDSRGTQAESDQFLFQTSGTHTLSDHWVLKPVGSIFYRNREDNTVTVATYSARQLRLGASAQHSKGKALQTFGWQSEQETGRSSEIFGRKRIYSHAIYSHMVFPWEKWEFDGGIRAHQEMNRFLSWNFGARYWISPGLNWKAQVAQGSKRPSIYQLHSTYGNMDLVSSRATSKETSLQWLGEDFFADFTLFETHTKNLIDFNLITSRFANLGRARNRGFEISTQWQGKGFELQQSFTRLESIDQITGLKLFRRPNHQWSQEVIFTPQARWQAQIAGRWVGRREDLHPQLFTRQQMPSFYVMNSSVSYLWEKDFKLEVRVENLADRIFQETSGFGTSRRAFYAGIETSL